jgi:hypothetical protein
MPQMTISFLRDAELAPDDGVEVGEGRLWAGVEAAAAGRDHEGADEDAEVQPGADLEVLVEREDESHGRAEELEVPAPLAFGALEIPLPDPQQPVHVPADLAPAREEGLAPVHRVVVPVALVRRLALAVEGAEDLPAETVAHLARDHAHLPGLDIGAARRARGERQQLFDRRAVHRRGQERTHGTARPDGLVGGKSFAFHPQGFDRAGGDLQMSVCPYNMPMSSKPVNAR